MNNYLIKILLFVTVLFGTTLTFQTISQAAGELGCNTDADGKLIIEDASATRPVGTGGTSGKVMSTDGGTAYDVDGCEYEPDFYKLIGYKILMCIDDPYNAGTLNGTSAIGGVAPSLEKCPAVIVDTRDGPGKEIILPKGGGMDLIGSAGVLELRIGTYNHAVLIASNHLGIKHTMDYVRKTNGGAFTMQGFKDHAGTHSTGSKCWSVDGTATTYTNTATNESGGVAGGSTPHTNSEGVEVEFTLPTPGGTPRDLAMACGDAVSTSGADKIGYSTEIIDSIDQQCDTDCGTTFDNFVNYGVDALEDGSDTAFNLLQDDLTIATTRVNATKIAYFVKFVTPVVISEQTVGFKILVGTSGSVSIDVHEDENDGGDDGDDVLEAKKLGANPFTVKFQTKERRARRMGAWR